MISSAIKSFNCFNILWDIDDDQDVFQSQLPREMSVEVDVSDISHANVLNEEITDKLSNSIGLCVLEFDCEELESFSKEQEMPDDLSQKERGFSDDGLD